MKINYDFTDNQTFSEVLEKDLSQPNETADIQGRISLWGDTKSSIIMNINHTASDTSSKVVIHAVLKDNAELNISGDIHIDKSADNCDANFQVKIIKLSDKSRANILPQLRIDNRKVKAAKHAVVIKKINEADLYFLASRGIPKQRAEDMIIKGFLS